MTLDDEAAIAAVEQLEAERCRAISQQDWPALDGLLHEDFLYGFLSGRLEDKTVYLAGLPSRPHGVTSRRYQARRYGDTVVLMSTFVSTNATTGEVANEGTGLGVWLDEGDRWRIVAYHTTSTGPPVAP